VYPVTAKYKNSLERKRAILILKIFGQEITAKKRFKIKAMRKCS
jgi:hypothetical protein